VHCPYNEAAALADLTEAEKVEPENKELQRLKTKVGRCRLTLSNPR